MAKFDEIYRRGDIVVYMENGREYKVLALFENTVMLRDMETKEVLRAIDKERIWKA